MARQRAKKRRLTIMVSSTVYGIEDLLDQVYTLLSRFGYEVWMSHKGTIPVDPNLTALELCLAAVERCDLFLSIITPQYGTGVLHGQLGISHQELLKAIALKKPRWVLAHSNVIFARSVFRKFGCRNQKEREAMLERLGLNGEVARKEMLKREARVIDDFRVIDMYEVAIRDDVQVYQNRKGNWVQKYVEPDDVKLFAMAQFSRYRDMEQFLKEQFASNKDVEARTAGGTSP